ncbi:hypothetical protein Scep_018834 [Stephania cephalantha]|uniref:Uncharacterized protein n=1 Tax=Stephania cephalantha TaxID=152367 RepID=A0AAP0I9Y3_9MAGN
MIFASESIEETISKTLTDDILENSILLSPKPTQSSPETLFSSSILCLHRTNRYNHSNLCFC